MDQAPIDELELLAQTGQAPENSQQVNEIAEHVNVVDDDAVVDYAQRTRVKMVQRLTENGQMPTETKDGYLLASVLNDLSNTAMAKKKLGASQRASDLDRQAQMFIAAVLQTTGNESPFLSKRTVATISETDNAPDLPLSVESEFEIEDTVLIQGLNTERYNEFTERMQPIVDAEREAEERALSRDTE